MADLTKAQLEEKLAAAEAKLADLSAGKPVSPFPASMIMTRSENEALSEADRQEFRKRNGTVIEDAAKPKA
jgi:hypothetical protein